MYDMKHIFLLMLFFLLTACSAALEPEGANTPVPSSTTTQAEDEAASPAKAASSAGVRNRRVELEDDYNFAFSLGFDSITPIYSPEFLPAADAALDDQELVLGIAWEGEAKAYPISVLRFREMVDDELAGIPTLVTW